MGKGILWAVGLAAMAIITGVFWAYYNEFSEYAWGGPAEWGMFGDYVGGLANPLLSFLTIFLLIVSLYIQSQELAATREELSQSKEALQNANEIQENNIILQTRNNLRPQLKSHYESCLAKLNSTCESTQILHDGIAAHEISIKTIHDICYRDPLSRAEKAAKDHWNGKWAGIPWWTMAINATVAYIDAVDAVIGLIEFSDSESIIDLERNKLIIYRMVFEQTGMLSKNDLHTLDGKIEEAIQKREALRFPAFHLNPKAGQGIDLPKLTE